jgi:hypothetical protein
MSSYARRAVTNWHRPSSADLESLWLPMTGNTRIHRAEMRSGSQGCKGFEDAAASGNLSSTYGTGERMRRASRITWWVEPHSLSYQAMSLTSVPSTRLSVGRSNLCSQKTVGEEADLPA